MRKTLLLTLLAATLASGTASAAGGHFGFLVGGWQTTFTQEGGGRTTRIESDPMIGFQIPMGVDFDLFFIEYTPSLYLSHIGEKLVAEGETDDQSYWSLAAGNFGLNLPGGLTPYVGGGVGNHGFSFGSMSDYSGYFYRAGLGFKFRATGETSIVIRAEYQKTFHSDDDTGNIPSQFKTRNSTWFIGLGALIGG